MLFKIDQVIHEIWLRIMLYLFFGSFRTGYCNMCKKEKKMKIHMKSVQRVPYIPQAFYVFAKTQRLDLSH
jgi:hypothetical protein